MGASGWISFTPYDPDPNAALQRLRQEVFATGQYARPFWWDAEHAPDAEDPTAFPPGDDAKNESEAQEPGDPFAPGEEERFLGQMRGALGAMPKDVRDAFARFLPEIERELRRSFRAVQAMPVEMRDAMLDGLGGATRPPGGEPQTIDELLEWAAEEGTHSILDIERIAKRREFGSAVPLSAARMRRLFGTTEPTHAQVERVAEQLQDELDRWQAWYVAIYRDGQPHEYAFIGVSGD
jgi:hypothetical protein